MAPIASQSVAPVMLLAGDDDFAVKRRAKELFQKWCAEVGFQRFEVIPLAGPSSAAVAYK